MDGTEVGILGNGKGAWRCVRVFTSSHLAKQKPCILSRVVVWQRNLSVFTFAIGHQNILPISTYLIFQSIRYWNTIWDSRITDHLRTLVSATATILSRILLLSFEVTHMRLSTG